MHAIVLPPRHLSTHGMSHSSGMAHVNEGSHSFSCHLNVYQCMEWGMPAFTLPSQGINAHWWNNRQTCYVKGAHGLNWLRQLNSSYLTHICSIENICSLLKGKGKGRTLVIAPLQADQPPQRRSGTWRAQSSVAHTCLYTFLTIASTHLPTPTGWRVE